MLRRVALLLPLIVVSACAVRAPSIADVQSNPSRYYNRTIELDGTVTTGFGVPFVPFRFYKIDDGTGELIVLGRGSRTPTNGARVRVTGRVADVAVIGGQSIGLHVEERDLQVRRR